MSKNKTQDQYHLTVEDKISIYELFAKYARSVDTKDYELYKSVFWDDAVIDYRNA
eukprot:Pgem_evm1s13416